MSPMVYPNHSKGRYHVESSRNQITSGSGGKNGIMEKLLGCVCASTAAVSPGRKDENVSYTVSEPSLQFPP